MIRRFALIAIVMLAAADAGATDSRITALGEGAAFYEDDRGVMRWYGSLADYPDLLTISSGHFTADDGFKGSWGQRVSGPGAGAHFQFDENGAWGTGAVYWHTRGDDADPGSLHRRNLGDHFTFMWGKNIGEEMSVGLMWRDAGESWTPVPEGDLVRGRQEAGLGLRFDLAERVYLDVAGEIRRFTNQAEGWNILGEPWKSPRLDSWNNFGVRARAFWGVSSRWVLVPLLEYLDQDDPATIPDGGDNTLQSGHLLRLGCGLNFLRDTDNLLVFSVDYMDGQVDHFIYDTDMDFSVDFRERYRAFLARAALEKRLAYWLMGRLSLGYEHLDNDGDFPHPDGGGTLLVSGGAGLQLGEFVLDLALAGREPQGFSRYAPTLVEEESRLWMSATFRWDF